MFFGGVTMSTVSRNNLDQETENESLASTTQKTRKTLEKSTISAKKAKKQQIQLKPSLSFSPINRERFRPLSFTVLAHEWLEEKDFKEKIALLNRICSEELTPARGYTKTIGTQINHLSQRLRMPCKNRFPTCLPFDKNIYIPSPGISYLNASVVHFGKHHYIAAQSPTPETISDFLSAVVNGKSNVIVTFTYPPNGEKITDWWNSSRGQIALKNGAKIEMATEEKIAGGPLPSSERITKRVFRVIYTDHEDKVTQLHYENYPVSGLPDIKLFNQLQDIADHLRSNKVPLFVQCNTGNGPSSSFIIAHSLNQEIRNRMSNGESLQSLDLNIEGQILDMRAQRDGMVEILGQLRAIFQSLSLRYDEYVVQPLKTKVKKGKQPARETKEITQVSQEKLRNVENEQKPEKPSNWVQLHY